VEERRKVLKLLGLRLHRGMWKIAVFLHGFSQGVNYAEVSTKYPNRFVESHGHLL